MLILYIKVGYKCTEKSLMMYALNLVLLCQSKYGLTHCLGNRFFYVCTCEKKKARRNLLQRHRIESKEPFQISDILYHRRLEIKQFFQFQMGQRSKNPCKSFI